MLAGSLAGVEAVPDNRACTAGRRSSGVAEHVGVATGDMP